MLEIAGLSCLACRVSALILGPAHRNGIVCSCSWLASRSIRLGFIQFTTNADQVSPILRTTPFEKPEIWHNTCGQHGSHDKICVFHDNHSRKSTMREILPSEMETIPGDGILLLYLRLYPLQEHRWSFVNNLGILVWILV